MTLLRIALLAMLIANPAFAAKPVPATRQACPVGYHPSGSYCVPNTSATKSAIPTTRAACPIGYSPSNGYCVKN